MKNKKLIIILGVLVVLILSIGIFSFYSLQSVSKTSDQVTFQIEPGRNKIEIVSDLKKAGLIKNKYVTLAYVFLTPKLNLQAGTYIINRNNSTIDIIKQIGSGNTKEKPVTIRITFVEGKRFVDYAKQISTNFDITYDDFIALAENKTFLKSLIEKYWFISDAILDDDIYYPLEGYLFPDTYEFFQNATGEDIIIKMLDNLDSKLTEIKTEVDNSKYSVHDVLTMASIIEKEAVVKEDRQMVSQVIYKRLNIKMNLGMDVTTYYAVFKDMTEEITAYDLESYNAYNTRNENLIGLPVGPICNPSLESINASLNPSDTDYTYFIADITTGKVYFASTYEDFINYKQKLGG